MKFNKIFFLSILLLTSCGNSYKIALINAEKMKETYYSDDYLFASTSDIYYKGGRYDTSNYIYEHLISTGEDVQKSDLGWVCCQNGNNIVYFLEDNKNKGENDQFYVIVHNIYSNETNIIDSFSSSEIIDRNINEEIDEDSYLICEGMLEPISNDNLSGACMLFIFKENDGTTKYRIKVYFSYDIEKSEKVYEGRDKSKWINNQILVENQYLIDFNNPDLCLSDTYNWDVGEKVLLQDPNFRKIRNEIYQIQYGFTIDYHFCNGTIFLEVYSYDDFVMFNQPCSKYDTVKMIFKMHFSKRTVEYLGYIPLKTYLRGVFYKEPR